MVSFPTRWFHSQVGKARDCKSLTSGPNPLGTSTALVAQLDRVFDYESKGQEFESLRGHHIRELAQFGSAPALGAGGHGFESPTLDHRYIDAPQSELFLCLFHALKYEILYNEVTKEKSLQ